MSDVKGSTGNGNIVGLHEFSENTALWKMLIGEFLGTLILVLIGCGSCISITSHVQIALTFGLVLATLAQAIGHISGCHVNPAVTLSFFVTGEINLIRSTLFIIVQCIGAIAGAAILKSLLPNDMVQGNLGLTKVAPGISSVNGMFFELILTFVFIFVIHAVCDGRRNDIKGSPALAIGLALATVHLSGIHFTGSSVNPARTLGPSVIMNFWTDQWVYWVGPIVGGVLAGLTYRFIFKVQKGENDSYDF
ncbi:hypothetical protein ABEB36_002165 [Hypothenemus hampei]|uniref:Uncharacterized protein n=1 Tax=Hypothenemus hampei TaxID=57062 RepID=A0ABD1F7X4_HYPHA